MWQGLHNSGESSAGGSANSSSDGSEGSSSASMLLQSCHSIVTVLARTSAAAVGADNTVAAQQHNSLELAQLPVSHAQCCKLLQDYVRLAAAAAAAEPSSTTEEHFTLMLGVVAAFLGDVVYQSDSSILLTSGPLVARIAAAGDVSSPDALQLFGLVCSWLKLYTASGGDTSIAASRMLAHVLADDSSAAMDSSTIHTMDQQTISTAVLAAVSSLVKAAIGGGDSSGMYSGSSNSSTGGSKACKAVLPWLVLLGRSCSAWAVLVQHWQLGLESDGPGPSADRQPLQSIMYEGGLAKRLQQLHISLEGVVQWLAAAGTVKKLTTLGYQPHVMQQQLAEAAEALLTIRADLAAYSCADRSRATTMLQGARQVLHAAGRVLDCFAIPYACNNMACSNMRGASEAQLVGGHSCICAGCRTARYCGRSCQRAAWRQHKPICKALAAAAAASGAASATAQGNSTTTD